MELGEKETYVNESFGSAWQVLIRPRKALDCLKHLARMIDIMSDTERLLRKESNENACALREIHKATGAEGGFYSWQRIWQNVTRMRLGLSPEATMEDLQVALLLESSKEDA